MRFALRLAPDILERAQGYHYFASINIKSAHQQIPIDPKSEDLLGICMTSGSLRYTRLPFGLDCAPARFQQTMNSAFFDLLLNHVQSFLDDIIIANKTFEEHI